jgi:hypothetical protein
MLLQHALGVPTPAYLHTPLVLMPDGEKLSKQHGATPLDLGDPLFALYQAASVLGLPPVESPATIPDALHTWVLNWQGFTMRPVTDTPHTPAAPDAAPTPQGQAPAGVLHPKTIAASCAAPAV